MRLTNCSGCETRSLNWQRPGEGLAEGVDEGRRNDCFRPEAVTQNATTAAPAIRDHDLLYISAQMKMLRKD